MQEVFLPLWHKADQFRPERGSFGAWFMTIARTPKPTIVPTSTPQPIPTPGSGPHWQVVSIPNVGTVSRLRYVAVISADDIWAVGQAGVSTLTMHWDGTAWSIVPSPNITGNGVQNDLCGVAAIAPDDVWAVGSTVDPNISFGWKTLVLPWMQNESCSMDIERRLPM